MSELNHMVFQIQHAFCHELSLHLVTGMHWCYCTCYYDTGTQVLLKFWSDGHQPPRDRV